LREKERITEGVISMSKNPSLLLCFLICLPLLIVPLSLEAGTTTIYVDPPRKIVLTIGGTFSVNVTVADVNLLFAWEFQVYYDSGILNASAWTPGPAFTPSPTVMSFNQTWTDNYDATHGLIHIVCTFIGARTFNGTTTLATVYFKIKSAGVTPLSLQNTTLLDNQTPFPQEMPHTTTDGTVYAGTIPGDVAVTSVTTEKNVAGQGYPTGINVTVTNNGVVSETFNVTLRANATAVETQTVANLSNGSSTTLTLVWDTTGFSYGNYTITVYAQPVPGETHTEDNTLASPWPVMVGIPGDMMPTFGLIDMKDVAYVARRFGAHPADPLWDPNADITGDAKVDMRDIAIVARNFGQHYS
jgi:hypothetical protein